MKQSHKLPHLRKRRFFVCDASFLCGFESWVNSPHKSRKNTLNRCSGLFEATIGNTIPSHLKPRMPIYCPPYLIVSDFCDPCSPLNLKQESFCCTRRLRWRIAKGSYFWAEIFLFEHISRREFSLFLIVVNDFFPAARANITKYLCLPRNHKKKLPGSTKMRRKIHKMETWYDLHK